MDIVSEWSIGSQSGAFFWQLVDPETGDEKKVTITEDDGIRPNASLADLLKLKTVFKKSGTTTAGLSLDSSLSYLRSSGFGLLFHVYVSRGFKLLSVSKTMFYVVMEFVPQ